MNLSRRKENSTSDILLRKAEHEATDMYSTCQARVGNQIVSLSIKICNNETYIITKN